MRRLLIIFSIFLVVNTSAYSNAPDPDLRTIARNLFDRVTNSENHLNKIQLDTTTLREKLDKIKDTSDFGIPKHALMNKIDELINQRRLNRGVLTCIKLKDEKTHSLIQELRSRLVEKVNSQLNNYRIVLTDIHKTLQDIFNSIQGKYLDTEVENCEKNPETCKLKLQYPNDLNHAEDIMHTIDNVLGGLIDLVLRVVVNPVVSNKINSEIYKPVNECLSKL